MIRDLQPVAGQSLVRGVRRFEMRHVADPVRGNLTMAEFSDDLPFIPCRYFITYAIPASQVRGDHAHLCCSQFVVCVSGCCDVSLDDGLHQDVFHLDRPTLGLLIPPLTWTRVHHRTADSALLVLASHPYEARDYIHDYRRFLTLASTEELQTSQA
ncbi:MAG: TDP-4-oxo-6-deoxy-alpha-D-glucose-3,4-oxoisomerase [Prosthecobacter sp.]|nr:TDP-4-oxo-6-deoxy-alpha-D-glucose-3,4-oxoisomerase [Prosthecobacter sp.]